MKTVGLTAPLQAALAPFAEHITDAFVYGSLAKGTDTAQSDVDLMIVGEELDYPKVYEALQEAERILDRKVNPTLYSRKEFRKRRREQNPFLERVLAQPKLWMIGSEHAFD